MKHGSFVSAAVPSFTNLIQQTSQMAMHPEGRVGNTARTLE
jgi:hypothetical protein